MLENMRKMYLNARTFKMTVEARPFRTRTSTCIMGKVMTLNAWKRQKSMIAMISWENKKKRGAVVTFRTHLLLRSSVK